MSKRLSYYTATNLLHEHGFEETIRRVSRNIFECRKLGEKEELEFWEEVLEAVKEEDNNG